MKKKLLGMATLTALTIGLTSCGGTATVYPKEKLIQTCNRDDFEALFKKEMSTSGYAEIGGRIGSVYWHKERDKCLSNLSEPISKSKLVYFLEKKDDAEGRKHKTIKFFSFSTDTEIYSKERLIEGCNSQEFSNYIKRQFYDSSYPGYGARFIGLKRDNERNVCLKLYDGLIGNDNISAFLEREKSMKLEKQQNKK